MYSTLSLMRCGRQRTSCSPSCCCVALLISFSTDSTPAPERMADSELTEVLSSACSQQNSLLWDAFIRACQYMILGASTSPFNLWQ